MRQVCAHLNLHEHRRGGLQSSRCCLFLFLFISRMGFRLRRNTLASFADASLWSLEQTWRNTSCCQWRKDARHKRLRVHGLRVLRACAGGLISRGSRVRVLGTLAYPPGEEEKWRACVRSWRTRGWSVCNHACSYGLSGFGFLGREGGKPYFRCSGRCTSRTLRVFFVLLSHCDVSMARTSFRLSFF